MTAFEQIDYLLAFFYSKKDTERDILSDSLLSNPDLLKMAGNSTELERMIAKLKEDAFIFALLHYPKLENGKDDMSKGLFNYFTITFDGRLFHENGGYTQRKINLDAESNRIKSNESAVLFLTLVLSGGTLPIGLLAVADLYWKYHWFRDSFWWKFLLAIAIPSLLAYYIVRKSLSKRRKKR